MHLSRSPLSQSSGSSLIELGNTKLLVSVRGPRSVGRCSFGKEGGLVCEGELFLKSADVSLILSLVFAMGG